MREILSRSWIFAYFNLYLQQNDIVNRRRGFFWVNFNQKLLPLFYRVKRKPLIYRPFEILEWN